MNIDDIECIERIPSSQQGTTSSVCSGIWRGTKVAIKYLTRGNWKPVSEEAKLLKLASYPNICRFYGMHWNDSFKRYGIVTEFISGQNLENYVQSSPVTKQTAYEIAKQLAWGIYSLHNHNPAIYHGDLIPNNVMVNVREDQIEVKITDFGYAHLETGFYQPYVSYRVLDWIPAPEVIQTGLTDKTDVFSYGLILLYLLTGLRPQGSLSILKTNLSFGEYGILGEIAEDCTAENPEERPTMKQILQRLENFRESPIVEERKYVPSPDTSLYVTTPPKSTFPHFEADTTTKSSGLTIEKLPLRVFEAAKRAVLVRCSEKLASAIKAILSQFPIEIYTTLDLNDDDLNLQHYYLFELTVNAPQIWARLGKLTALQYRCIGISSSYQHEDGVLVAKDDEFLKVKLLDFLFKEQYQSSAEVNCHQPILIAAMVDMYFRNLVLRACQILNEKAPHIIVGGHKVATFVASSCRLNIVCPMTVEDLSVHNIQTLKASGIICEALIVCDDRELSLYANTEDPSQLIDFPSCLKNLSSAKFSKAVSHFFVLLEKKLLCNTIGCVDFVVFKRVGRTVFKKITLQKAE